MVTSAEEKQYKLFSINLNKVLDSIGFPPKGKGRQVELAKMFGVSDKAARKWLEGQSMPKRTRLPEMATRLNVTTDHLLKGETYVLGSTDHHNINYHPFPDYTLIPKYNIELAMGDGAFNSEEHIVDHFAFKTDWLKQKHLTPSQIGLVTAKGDSMSPTIKDGSIVLVNLTEKEPKDGDIYAIRKQDDSLLIKRYSDGRDPIVFCGDNEPRDRGVDASKVTVVGKVVWKAEDI